VICADGIKNNLNCRDVEVRVYDIIDSTNTEAKRYAADTCDFSPVLFVAKEQSGGRGRLGRQFLSRATCGIYMSLLYFTEDSLSDAISITTSAAVTVAVSIERITGKKMRIKWVNDIYNEKGKVCGILTEALEVKGRRAIVVGIGINVGDVDFPEELRGIASTIGDVGNNAGLLVASITDGLLLSAENPADKTYMSAYRQRLMMVGDTVDLFRGGELMGHGTVLGVDDEGGLLFVPSGKDDVEVIRSGEISVRMNNKR
jgi:BirA family biotin operon repressor/biotin-[acetyl-CoA-carboxylase] ligase